MFGLSRKEDKFHVLFVRNAEMAHEAAILLNDYVHDLENKEYLKQIKAIERKGDLAVKEIIEELNKTFLTPFDREDIYAIAKEMDDVLDYIERAASRFDMFHVKEVREGTFQLCEMIVEINEELVKTMKELHNMDKNGMICTSLCEINKIEETGDTVSRSAIKKLFDVENQEIAAMEVIKWREIFKLLEDSLDSAQHVANLVEGVVMKNA